MIQDSEFELVSQLSHFFAGLAIVLVGYLWGHQDIAFCLWGLYAAFKEFWYDERYETPEIRGSSLKDFLFQVAGGAVGLTLIFIAEK